jgi:hypothetical protein
MLTTVISGDIVASTSLSDEGRVFIEKKLKKIFKDLKKEFNVYGRIIKGDYIECVVPEPENALQVALAIKCFVKANTADNVLFNPSNARTRNFNVYGIRLAIGYGNLTRFDAKKGIIDGEAIYLSGRTISEFATYNKDRIVIKNTLYFASANEKLNFDFEALFALIDILLSKSTAKQCKVLYLKLMNFNENEISKKLKIAQSVVNQHSTSSGWNAIEKAVNYFNQIIKNQ